MSMEAPTQGLHAFERPERLQLKIGGMSCSFCAASITKALGRMEGVRKASVNLAHEEALIAYDPARIGLGYGPRRGQAEDLRRRGG